MPIYVVGAGPGDPSLLTLRAVELLRAADIVALGDLVNPEIVKRYAPSAKVVRIGHRREEHDRAIDELVEYARGGANVVVLKNGDPTIFGRAFTICDKAFEKGVPCEIVPGVASFTAASAAYRIPLTERCGTHSIALMTFPFVSGERLSSIGTDVVVIFMMGDRRRELANALEYVRHRVSEIYICYRITYPDGGCIRVGDVEALMEADVPRPALFIIVFKGECS